MRGGDIGPAEHAPHGRDVAATISVAIAPSLFCGSGKRPARRKIRVHRYPSIDARH